MTFPREWKLPGLALLLAAGLLAVLAAAGAFAPPGVGGQTNLRNVIEVDGGRSSEMVFEVTNPSPEYLNDGDEIEISLPAEFTLPSSVDKEKIGLSGSGDGRTEVPNDPKEPAPIDDHKLTLTIPDGLAARVMDDEDEHLVITIESGSGIVAPETPIGFDDPDDGYDVTITFVDANGNVGDGTTDEAEDKNIVVVKNPVSSTVPNARVRVELVTRAEAPISGSEEITVDFSGPSADSEFNLPSTITKTRITIRPDGESSFSPSDVLVQGAT